MFYNSHDNIGLVRVLLFLKSHSSEYLSGQDLSDVLKISRVAVWKHIRTIKELGYVIEARQRRGYRLVGGTDRLLPWELAADLGTKRIGRRAYYFDEVDSTQDYAMELARSGDVDGYVVAAERQTHGRGRMKRRWMSPDGGIWMSIILKPRLDHASLSFVPIAAGAALAGAIQKTSGIDAKLKWPNDVVIQSKKVAGIITDAAVESGRLEYVVVGTGINFGADVEDLERLMKDTPHFYGITSILCHDKNAKRLALAREFLVEFERRMGMLENGDARTVIKDWTAHSDTIGRKVEIVMRGGGIRGTATGIDDDGALMIRTTHGIQRALAGDVEHLR